MYWLKKLRHSFLLGITLVFVGCGSIHNHYGARHRTQEMVERGVRYLRVGALSQAEAAFRVALDTSTIPEAYDGLACTFFLQGDHRAAQDLFTKIIGWYPDYAPAKANLALLYDVRGERERAKILYGEAISLDPLNNRFRNNYGALLAKSELLPERRRALDYLQEAYVIGESPIIQANLDTIVYNTEVQYAE